MNQMKVTLRLKVRGTDDVAEFTSYLTAEAAYRVQAEYYKKCLTSPIFQQLNELIVEENIPRRR